MNLPRIDRILTLYCFYLLNKMMHVDKKNRIPILMYHSISNEQEKGVHPYYRINTSQEIFIEHMNYLHDNNYSVINLGEAVKTLTQPINKSSSKSIKYTVITFDDGYRDFYTHAYPILQKYGFTATVFLPTGMIDNKELKLKGKEHLTWDEVRELHNAGICFGSHTVTHPQLKTLSREKIEHEIKYSKDDIENNLGESVDSFSYPYKFPEEDKDFTTYLKNIIMKSGYKYGVSTRLGTASKNDDKYILKRLPVNSCDDIPLFKAKLEGGYDWLHNIQYILKVVKKNAYS